MAFTSALKMTISRFPSASKEWGQSMNQEPRVSLAKEAFTWLEKIAPLEDVATIVMPDAQRAIEDARP
jgi:hypothetical protein